MRVALQVQAETYGCKGRHSISVHEEQNGNESQSYNSGTDKTGFDIATRTGEFLS